MSLSFISFVDCACGFRCVSCNGIKKFNLHVLRNLASIAIISTSFDLQMSRGGVNNFSLVINFLNESWTPMHVTMGLFKVNETSGQSMAIQLESLLSKFKLAHRVIAFVKDEGSNLTSMAFTLCSIIDYQPLRLLKVYEGICFGHVMYKACQQATNGNKVSKCLVQVSVKDVQAALQKTITLCTKKSGKGRQEWEKACIECGMPPRKLKTVIKTKFASKVIMFEKTLKFKRTIITCYGRQKIVTL